MHDADHGLPPFECPVHWPRLCPPGAWDRRGATCGLTSTERAVRSTLERLEDKAVLDRLLGKERPVGRMCGA